MGKTSIEWTDASWNPIVGCTEISPGCANCYAARLSASRLAHVPAYKGLTKIETDNATRGGAARHVRWTGEVRFLPERLEEPLHWKKPRRIFVCDMGDLFHESVKLEWLHKIFATIFKCPQHTFQILTKRAHRMLEVMNGTDGEGRFFQQWPMPNVWIGVSVENQHFADERIPLLLQTPAAVRWISAEPLLGPVDLRYIWEEPHPHGPYLDWVVCGGESGPHARPMHPDWARSLRDQCQAAGVPFFFKQWGEFLPVLQDSPHLPPKEMDTKTVRKLVRQLAAYRVGKKLSGRLLDGREWNEFPYSGKDA